MLERYGAWANNHVAQMKPEVKGDWVRYADAQATIADLQGQVKAAQQTIEAQEKSLQRVDKVLYCKACHGHGVWKDRLTENEWGPPYPCPVCTAPLQQRVAQLEAGVNVCRERYDKLSTAHGTLHADHARVLGLVRAAVVQIEQVEGDLHAALNGTRHDPSWIRPIQLSRNERQELYLSCEAQLKAIRASLPAQPACTNHFSDGSKIFPSRECSCKPAQRAQGLDPATVHQKMFDHGGD